MQHRTPEDQERLLQEFRAQCRQGGLAVTHQREIIYRTLIEMESHPTPEAIYEIVREQIPVHLPGNGLQEPAHVSRLRSSA